MDVKKITDAQAAMNAAHQHPCPSCGHCPTCGRGGYTVAPYPYWPRPYGPYWYGGTTAAPQMTWGQTQTTSGGLSGGFTSQ